MSKSNETVILGGMLPIFISQDKIKRLKDRKTDEEDKKPQYKSHKSSVSIKDIMSQRKSVNPFILM